MCYLDGLLVSLVVCYLGGRMLMMICGLGCVLGGFFFVGFGGLL